MATKKLAGNFFQEQLALKGCSGAIIQQLAPRDVETVQVSKIELGKAFRHANGLRKCQTLDFAIFILSYTLCQRLQHYPR